MKKRERFLRDKPSIADNFCEVNKMKINAFLQSLNMGNKVRDLSQNAKEKSVSETLVEDSKTKMPAEIKSILNTYQIKPDSEAAKGIMQFVDQTDGSLSAKIETIEIALYKGIEPTADNLNQLHQALVTEGGQTDITFDATAEVKGTDAMEVIAHLKLPESVKTALLKKVSAGQSLKEAVRNLVLEMAPNKHTIDIKSTADISLGQLLRVLKQLLSESKSTGAVQTLVPEMDTNETDDVQKSQVISNTNNMPQSTKSSEQMPVNEGADHSDALPSGAIAEPSLASPSASETQAPSTAEPTTTEVLVDTSEALSEPDLQVILDAVDAVLAQASDLISTLSQTLDIKVFLVETTTSSMLEAKKAFETFKVETSQLLEQTTPEKQSVNLEKAIETLNQIILKGDVTKYTDMLTEKKLLIMSADLEKAQALLKQGDFNKALEVVKSAKTLLEGISYNPSTRRVQVFTQGKMDRLEEALEKPEQSKAKLDDYIKRQIEPYKEQGMPRNARDVLEVLRFLGLNHEMEVAEGLEKKTDDVKKEWAQGNIKEILLKLMKENREEKSVESTSQSLMNLSGQQMMNDSQPDKQPFHFFNMPFMDGEEVGNMKVYMKGHNNNQQMDWKNTEMYFGMQLKKHGPLGIKVKIQDQTVDLQILSDAKIDLKSAFEPVLDALADQGFKKGTVKIMGYNEDKGMHLRPMSTPVPMASTAEPLSQKGFDYKI